MKRILLVTGALLLQGQAPLPAQATEPSMRPAVKTPLAATPRPGQPAEPIPSAASTGAIGLSEPLRDAVLGSPVIGIIGRHFFEEGDLVEEGDVILELRKEIEQIEASRRKTILESAKKALDRTSQLFKNTRSVSEEAMEQTQAQHDVALAEYELAMENLRRRQIIAPFTGRITDFFGLEAGESVAAQTPLVRLVDTSRCYFVSNIDARGATGLRAGDSVTVEIDQGVKAIRVPGTVTFVSPVVDPASGLLRVRVLFDNAGDAIRPGLDGVMTWNPE